VSSRVDLLNHLSDLKGKCVRGFAPSQLEAVLDYVVRGRGKPVRVVLSVHGRDLSHPLSLPLFVGVEDLQHLERERKRKRVSE